MATSSYDRSPAELVEFVWERTPEATWFVADEATPEERKEWTRRTGSTPFDGAIEFDSGERGKSYAPLKDEPALFREFAALAGDAESFAEFARRFGPLESTDYLDNYYRGDPAVPMYLGNLEGWVSNHTHLRDAVAFFDALQARTEVEVLPKAREVLFEREPQRSPRMEVQAALSRLIEQYMWVTPTLVRDGTTQGTGLRLTFLPRRGLISAMWLQLALAVDGNRTYKACDYCGRWWDATDAYPTKHVCSDTCRKALHRRKQKDAAEGASHDDAS